MAAEEAEPVAVSSTNRRLLREHLGLSSDLLEQAAAEGVEVGGGDWSVEDHPDVKPAPAVAVLEQGADIPLLEAPHKLKGRVEVARRVRPIALVLVMVVAEPARGVL
jgi:hypothetical protein